ncbi:MAG: GNAT family N-acetyltransferase [Rhabdochlamydiaceae bacterium]
MVALEGYDIRFSKEEDLIHLRRWLSSPEIERFFPYEDSKEREQASLSWIGFSRYKASLTALVNEVPCGIATLFLMPYKKVSHHALTQIVIDPFYQRKGIGRSLLRNIKHLAKSRFCLDFIDIEVMASNPIIALLHQEGFKEVFRQADFFQTVLGYEDRVFLEADL